MTTAPDASRTGSAALNLAPLILSYHKACELTGAELCHAALQRVYTYAERLQRAQDAVLDLSHLYFGPGTARGSCDGFEAFISAVCAWRAMRLTKMDLTGTLFTDGGLCALSRAAVASAPQHGLTTLTTLRLRQCGLREVQYALPRLLAACPCLSVLDLSGNRLGCAPDSFLAATVAMAQHQALASLDLSDNFLEGNFGSVVLRGLCELIVMAAARPRACAALTHLDLRDNQLGSHDNKAPGDAQDRVALLSLHPLLDALLLNNDLTSVVLSGNAFSPAVLSWAEAKVEMNNRSRRRLVEAVASPRGGGREGTLTGCASASSTEENRDGLKQLHASFQRAVAAKAGECEPGAPEATKETIDGTPSWRTEDVAQLVTDIFFAVDETLR